MPYRVFWPTRTWEFTGRVLSFIVPLVLQAAEPSDPVEATVAPFFRPFQIDHAALAPDGRLLALSEHLRGKASILLVDLADQSTRRVAVSGEKSSADHGVIQMLWQSPTRLIFTTRSRGVGVLDTATNEIKALLRAEDVDGYRPRAMLGARRRLTEVTPDLPSDPTRSLPRMEFGGRREVDIEAALNEATDFNDLFEGESRASGRSLKPFLLGIKDGDPAALLIELRTDRDLLDQVAPATTKLTVPANVVVTETFSAPPSGPPTDDVLGPYFTYDVSRPAPPHLVLQLDTVKRRRRVISEHAQWQRVWLDQQGRPRVALEAIGDRRRYLYRSALQNKWIPLDELAKAEGPLGFTVTPETLLSPRSVPLGFDLEGNILFFASNVGHDTFGLRALDTTTGRATELEVRHARFDLIEATALTGDELLVFDRYSRKLAGVRFASAMRDTLWIDAEVAQVQAGLAEKFPAQRCAILDWDAARQRFLVELSSPADPGTYGVFDRARNKFFRCGQRAPGLENLISAAHEFDFTAPDGHRLHGCVTLPRQPRLDPPPTLVYFHDGPWLSDAPVYNRGAQALAALGFAVVQINYRGSSGFGHAHLKAIQSGFDRVVLEDVKAVLARAGGTLRVNPRMAATFGNGFGGYLALRMTQLAPETFRCAVAINTPADLVAWQGDVEATPSMLTGVRRHFFGENREMLQAISAMRAATPRPVLVVHGANNHYVPVAHGRQLHQALKKKAPDSAYLEFPREGHGGWSQATTAQLFAELGRFFNATIYNYSVEVQPATVVP